MRIYGRKGSRRRVLPPLAYVSFTDAWPFIRSIIRLRLRHGYSIVELEDIHLPNLVEGTKFLQLIQKYRNKEI
jgi:hypothetical protein